MRTMVATAMGGFLLAEASNPNFLRIAPRFQAYERILLVIFAVAWLIQAYVLLRAFSRADNI
jgi:hypothetical protein